MSYLFVSHDLNVVRLLCDRIVVMYLGRGRRTGAIQGSVPRTPATPTRGRCWPRSPIRPGADNARRVWRVPPGVPINPDPNACRFYGRCPRQEERCARGDAAPARRSVHDHRAACHFAEETVQ